jgi:hypothetical protein
MEDKFLKQKIKAEVIGMGIKSISKDGINYILGRRKKSSNRLFKRNKKKQV